MSNEVDSRVVEMRFDNQQFERNVGQSLSTLDKLKAALRLDGVSKGLDEVNASAKKLDFRETVQGIDNVVKKFSTMELIGGVTIANLTNDAVNSAKRLAKALTFDPVKMGLEEYETQINAVQTILANTSHNGTTLDEVNEALDELNRYADMTIYNFTQMTKNIGTFTAAGVDLETSTSAIKGIANLAAVSGSTSQQASTAMYQLSQALAAGKVSLMDWNSVVNAGMGGKVFQDALTRTSEVLGTGAKNAIEMYGSFRESLTKGEWLTTEVLTETLSQFAGAYDKAELISKGYTEEQADEIVKMAETATNAATKVKTFTQLIDTLKEAVQSGWTQTFEILIGDFEEAKAMWTSVSDFFNGIIGSINDARNRVLESAFGTMFSNLDKPLAGLTNSFEQTIVPVEGMATALGDLDAMADRVISGEFGNMQGRWDQLTELGWNWISVQNKVNEKLGVTLRRDEDLAEGYRGTADASKDAAEAEKARSKALADALENLMSLSNEEFRAQGFIFEEIKAIRDLERVAKKTGIPLEELADNLGNINGRWIALRAVKNLGSALINVAKEMKHAWFDVFDFVSDYDKSMRIFDMIGAFNKFSQSIKAFTENREQMDKLSRTFRGLFAAIDIVQKILGAGFKIILEVVSRILENFGLNILDVTAAIGDAIYAFDKWLDKNETFKMVINAVADAITIAIVSIKTFIENLLQISQVQYVIENFGSILEWMAINVSSFLGGLGHEIQGVVDRAKELDGITFNNIVTVVKDLFGSMANYIGKVIFGIDDVNSGIEDVNSGIEDTGYNIGEVVKKDIIGPFEGAVESVNALGKSIGGFLKDIAGKFRDDIGIGEILTMIFGGGMIYAMTKENGLFSTLQQFAESFSGIGESIQNMFDTASETIASFQNEVKARQILYIALAISALAASLWLLSTINKKKLGVSLGSLVILAGVLTGLAFLMGRIDVNSSALLSLIGFAGALAILVVAFNAIEIDYNSALIKWGILMSFVIAMSLFAVTMTRVAGPVGSCIKVAGTFIAMAVALNLMVLAFKFLDTCNPERLTTNVFLIVELIAAMSLLAIVLGLVRPCPGSALVLIGMASSLLMILTALHLLTKLPIESISAAMEPIKTLLLLFIAVMAISRLAGQHAARAGAAILMVSVAINLLIGAIYACSLLPATAVKKATETIGKMLAMFALLIFVSGVAGEFAAKAGVLLICAGAAMTLFSIAAFILALIDPKGLKRAVAAMSQLMVFMALIVAVSGFARRVKAGPFIAIATALGILMISLGAISMIKEEELWKAVGAMSIIMFMLSLVIASSRLATGCVDALLVLTLAVTMIGALLVVMSLYDMSHVIENATAIGLVMMALSGSMWIISKSGEPVFKAAAVMAVMSAVLIIIGAVLWGMSCLDTQNALVNAVALGVVMMALSGSLWILSKAGEPCFTAVGAVALLAVVLVEIGLILAIMSNLEVDKALPNCVALSVLLGALAGVMALLTKLNVGSVGGIKSACLAALALDAFIIILGGVMLGLFALFGLINDEGKALLQNGIDVLCMVFEGLGRAVGVIFKGLGEGLTAGLPKMGDDIAGFCIAFSKITPQTASVMKSVGEAMLALTGAQLLDGLAKLLGFLTGEQSIGDFGASMGKLAKGMKIFAEETKDIDASTVGPACEAAAKIMEVCNIIPNSGGILSWIVGDNTADKFGLSLNVLGVGLSDFALMTNGIDWSGIPAACEAAKSIIDICNLIPNTKGIISLIIGDNDPAKFGSSLEALGAGFSSFAANVYGVDWSGVPDAKDNMEYIKGICEQIPADGNSWIDVLVGKKTTIESFGDGIKALGEAMKEYAESVTDIDWDNIAASSVAISDMRVIASSLPTEAELNKRISMEDFGKELIKFGTQLVKFSNKTEDIDVARMNLFAESFKNFAFAMDQVQWFDPEKFDNFSASIKRLGDVSIAELENTFKNSGRKVKTSLEHVINIIKKTINENADAMTIKLSAKVATGDGDEELDSAGKALIAAFTSAIDNALVELKAKDVDFSSMGSHYVIELMNGFESAKNLFVAAVKRTGDEAVNAINSSEFFRVGQYCAMGLINGINSKMNNVKMASSDMGGSILTAFRKILGIHSPSTEFYSDGTNCVKGYTNSIEDNSDKPVNAVREMGNKVRKVSKEIAEQANKDFAEAASGMTFGTDVLRSYLNTYGEFSEDAKANAKMIGDSKNLLINYAKQLYANSDQFNQDIEKLKECRDKMAELDAEKKKLDAELATADESKMSSLASKQQSLNEQIISCNKELENAMTTISDNIVASFTEIQNSIKETAKAAMDFMKIDVSTGVDLLRDPEKTTKTVRDKKTGKETDVEDATETQLEVMEKELNKVKDFREKIEALGETGLCDGLLKQLEELGPAGVEKIDEFLRMTAEEISKANGYYQENLKLSADVFLDNYAETIQVQKDFAENMKKLVGMNFDQGIVDALAKAGAEGSATYMDSFLSMSPAQVEEFNKKYAETLKVPDEVATDIMATLVKAGEQASQGFANGVDSQIENVLMEYNKVMVEPIAEIAEVTTSNMFEAGWNSVKGYIDGGNSLWNKFKNSKWGSMIFGEDGGAVGVAKDELVVRSPSRKFKEIGRYTVEGFVMGVNKYAYMANDSIVKMASGATDNAIKTLSGIDKAMARKAEYNVRVKPVVNMDDKFKKMSSSLNVTPIVNDAQIRPFNQTNTILKHVESSIAKNNADMNNRMQEFSMQMFNAMNEQYMNREVSLYVDGRKMASTLAQPMSREFKVLSNRGL